MSLTNADFRKMIAGNRDNAVKSLPTPTQPDQMPRRRAPESQRPRHQDVRNIEIVWTTDPAPFGRRRLGGLASIAKVLALPVLIVSSFYAQPAYECHKLQSIGMLYYGETIRKCVGDRIAEQIKGVRGWIHRSFKSM